MAVKERQNFLLLVVLILKYANDYVRLPFQDFLKKKPCICSRNIKLTLDVTKHQRIKPKQKAISPQHGCKRHIRDVILALVKVKNSSFLDEDFAKWSKRILHALILATIPNERQGLIHQLENFLIQRKISKNEEDILEKVEKWRRIARKKKLIIEDDKTKLRLAEELLKYLGHSLQRCKGVTAYSLGMNDLNLQIKYNPDEVKRDNIETFINRQLKGTDYDLSKRRYFSDIVTYVATKEIVRLQLECFPCMAIEHGTDKFQQTLGIFLEIEDQSRFVATSVTHGRVFNGQTQFKTHTTDKKWHSVKLGPHFCTVYREPKRLESGNDPAQMEVEQKQESFIDLCCIEVSKEQWLKLTEERGKCLKMSFFEPSDITVGDEIQKIGKGSGLKFGKIISNDCSFECHLNDNKVFLNNVIICEQEVIDQVPQDTQPPLSGGDAANTGGLSLQAAQNTMPSLPNLGTDAGVEQHPYYPDAISQKGDSGCIITTLPQEAANQNTVEAIGVHFGSYNSYSDVYKRELSYSVSFPLASAVKALEEKMGVKLKFIKNCIPDYEKRCGGK